jgi:hypothetical protein
MQLQPLSQEDKEPKTNIAIVSTIQFHKGEQPSQAALENGSLEALIIKDPKTWPGHRGSWTLHLDGCDPIILESGDWVSVQGWSNQNA